MRQEVQVYVTIKLKSLSQRFEESDEGDRQMGFGVVHCCYCDSTGRGEWGRRTHMSPSSEETPGHTGHELRLSLDFFSLTVLRFVVAHRRPPDYATCTYSSHIYRRSTE